MEQDTIKLLRECDSGVKMGVDSINDVLQSTRSPELKKLSLIAEISTKYSEMR